MGFGSYDESEREHRTVDVDFDGEDGVSTDEHSYEGVLEFENGASNDELLSRLHEIKDG